MTTQNIEQLLKLAEKYINQGMKSVQNPGKSCNMLLGMTRSGKSTLLNYLLGKKLIVDYMNPNAKGKEGKKLKIKLENQNQDGQAAIGHQINSETMIPKKYQSNDGQFKQVLFDNPGFGDNRGIAIDISNALLISELLKGAQNLRFILAVDIASITGDNIALFISLIKTMTQLFNIQNIKDHTCIVFTKVQENYQYEDIIADLEKTITHIADPGFDKELIKYMIQTHRISMFRKATKRGPLSNQNALQIASNILSVKPLLKLDLSKVKVGVSSQTKNILYSQNMAILQYTKKDLNKFLDYLNYIKVNQIQTFEQGKLVQMQFIEFVDNQIMTKKREKSIKLMIDRFYKAMVSKNIKIPDQLMKSIDSKLNMILFVKRILQMETMDVDEFQNDVSVRLSVIRKDLFNKLCQLQYKEGKINKQAMEAEKKRQQIQQKQFQATIELLNKQMMQMQKSYAQQMKQNNQDKKLKDQIMKEQFEQMKQMSAQMDAMRRNKGGGCVLI